MRIAQYARAAAYVLASLRAYGGVLRRTGYIKIPAIVAVMNAAIEPAIIDRMPNLAISDRRDGAIPPIPPI